MLNTSSAVKRIVKINSNLSRSQPANVNDPSALKMLPFSSDCATVIAKFWSAKR